jgi:flavin-dependent dehydrogenase
VAVQKADVFVIGGGPAGLAAAIAARRKGFTVALADGAEPPIDKPCGEGMMPEALTALRDLGVELSAAEGYRFSGIRFVVDGTKLTANFREGQGIGIRRPILHGMVLREAEKAGVKFFWKSPIRGIGAYEVQLPGTTIGARWIIGADGSSSRVRRWSGLDAAMRHTKRSATRRHYRLRPWSEYMEIHWGPHSQAYVTPVSREEVCVVVMAQQPEHADFERALVDLPDLREKLAGATVAGRERGAITAMHALGRVSRGNVALVGDASGGVDAITGEGLRLGFRQALALADAMERNDLSYYERAHRRLGRRPTYIGKLMLLLGQNAWLRERTMGILQYRPELFERLLAIHVGQATPRDMLTASAQFSWRFLAA